MIANKLNKKWTFFIWVLLWIPISFLFPYHEHFPLGGVISPISAIFLPFIGDSEHSTLSFDWKYVYTHALFFWIGGAIFVYSVQKFAEKYQQK